MPESHPGVSRGPEKGDDCGMKNSNSVLVTGASTGIGHHLTRYLAERGHLVYATARKESDLAALARIPNVVPITVDVRNPQQIRDALDTVTKAGRGLYGLVNNAGIGGLGMLSTWTDEEMLEIFDVNVFGPHRMTNAFVRMLIESKGRIVNIGSQGGMITTKYYGPYTMTKHALEAYTVALSLELQAHGVRVSIVQPGGIVSNVGANAWEGILARFRRAAPPFREEAEAVLAAFEGATEEEGSMKGGEGGEPPAREKPDGGDALNDEPESETNRKPSSPEIVSAAVYDALFSEKPKLRYLVGTKWEGDRVIHALIEKLLDENDNPQHDYSREELMGMMDRERETRKAR